MAEHEPEGAEPEDPWVGPERDATVAAPALEQPEPFPPVAVGARFAVTLAAVAVCEATLHIDLPGVAPLDHLDGELLSLGTLGVAPLATAFLLVEVVAVLLPGGRRLRAGGAAGRARLDFITVALTVVLTAVQAGVFAWNIAPITPTTVPVAMASLLGVTALYIAVAQWISRRGLGEGFAVLIAWRLARSCWGFWFDPPLALTLGVGALATIWIRRRRSPLPLPTAGLIPLYAVQQAIAAVFLMSAVGLVDALDILPNLDALGHERDALVPVVVGVALMAMLFDRAFAPDEDLARITDAQANLRRTTSATALAYAVPLAGASQLLVPGYSLHWAITGALVTGLAMDLFDAGRGHHAAPGRVAVWTFTRPLEVPQAVARLAAAEIEAHVTGLNLATLLQFFGPFTRPRLWV
ncbi:MAG: hypothetical protein KC933_40520, partial [Myxococcales bacterium]|nr:hypothetical protein [Myxococcales bacterium]